ncbi:hypothetical protein EB796_018743 [Bugula neritina]|uniref:Thioredoxin domain-containing protein n=1 Tax=Bugula neritina TaxID=10212 RepID=A0A7J7JBD6_BUGNE|nr:hypothetical protein EB796_018743 [Bugula neritina]
MVMFYAHWCPACQSLKPTWESFAKQWSEDLSISVGAVDINKNSDLSGQFLVFQLPTIFHIKDGVVRLYTRARSQDAFVNWVNDASWKTIEPIEWWKNPNSIHMKGVGYFFKFANFIKDIHEQLTETHQMPTWIVYGLFAVVTVAVGLLLGMMLVVICDCVYPPKPPVIVDQRQYSKIEIAKTPIKTPNKRLTKKEKAAAAAAAAPPDESPSENKEEAANTDEDVSEASTKEDNASSAVRKRKPRKD